MAAKIAAQKIQNGGQNRGYDGGQTL